MRHEYKNTHRVVFLLTDIFMHSSRHIHLDSPHGDRFRPIIGQRLWYNTIYTVTI